MKPGKIIKVVKRLVQIKTPVMLVGQPGCGKTDISVRIARELDSDFVLMTPAIDDPTDAKGMPTYNAEQDIAKFVPFEILQQLIETDRPTIVLLDDFGQANQSVQAAYMHLLLARRVGGHKISEQVYFIVATNDNTHHAGVAGIIEPVKSRTIIIHVEMDLDGWVEWAMENDIAPEVIGFIRLSGMRNLSNFQATMDMTNSPSARAQQFVSDIIKLELDRESEIELIKGVAGEAYSVEMRGFLALFRNLPAPEEILADPDGIDVPLDNPSVLYAYCGALTSIAAPEKMDAIVRFARRMPMEFQVKLLQYDCRFADPANHETQAYTDWALENQSVLTSLS